jgi:hypothetical protein
LPIRYPSRVVHHRIRPLQVVVRALPHPDEVVAVPPVALARLDPSLPPLGPLVDLGRNRADILLDAVDLEVVTGRATLAGWREQAQVWSLQISSRPMEIMFPHSSHGSAAINPWNLATATDSRSVQCAARMMELRCSSTSSGVPSKSQPSRHLPIGSSSSSFSNSCSGGMMRASMAQ